MKNATLLPPSVLAAAILSLFACLPSHAAEDPIPGVDVVVEKVPPGNAVFSATTDREGFIASPTTLPAGNYRVRGKSGETASIRHRGGPARWQLLQSSRDGKSIWTLRDASPRR